MTDAPYPPGDVRFDQEIPLTEVDYAYAREKLDAAMRVLVGAGTVQERLATVCELGISNIGRVKGHEPDEWLPQSVQEELDDVTKSLRAFEGLCKERQELSDDSASRLARDIARLQVNLIEIGPPSRKWNLLNSRGPVVGDCQ